MRPTAMPPQATRAVRRAGVPLKRPLICPPTNQLQQSFAVRARSKNGAKTLTCQPPPQDSFAPVITADHRPERAPRTPEDDVVQAGLLARGSLPLSAFPLHAAMAQWHCGGGARR